MLVKKGNQLHINIFSDISSDLFSDNVQKDGQNKPPLVKVSTPTFSKAPDEEHTPTVKDES